MDRGALTAVAVLVVTAAVILSGTATVRSATVTDPSVCVVERSGSTATLSWLDQGGRHVVRRNGSYLADAGRNVSSWTDRDAPPGATYELRSWASGVRTDRHCADGGQPPGPPSGGGDCSVERSGSTATIRWRDDGGNHVVRRNGSWLASPGYGTSSYVDRSAPTGATYEVRTWLDGVRTDRPCGSDGSGGPAPTTPPPPPPSNGRAQRVIHISIDGLRADHVTSSLMPNLTRLRNQGASTLNARTDPAYTQTLPNHHSMFTGHPVKSGDGHGVDYNVDKGRTVHQEAGGYVASVFDIVHDRGGSTSVYAGKSKFDMVNRNWGANGAVDRVGVNDGRDKIDEYRQVSPSAAVDRLRTALNQRPNLEYVFFHIRDPDNAGHQHAWGTSRYRTAVTTADSILGRVVDLVQGNPAWRDSTAIIVVADHGGPTGGLFHSDASRVGNYTIPFVVWGPGVRAGADLYALNQDDRREPGSARVWLGGVQPIRNGEVANLALDFLGYPPVPGSTLNRRQDLDVR